MRCKLKRSGGGVVCLLLILLIMSNASWGLLTLKNAVVKKGGNAVAAAVVYIIDGSNTKTTGASPFHSGATLHTFNADANGKAEFTQEFQTQSQVYLKAWEAGGPAKGKWYGTAGPFSIGLPKDTNRSDDTVINLTLVADVPAKPSVKVNEEALVRIMGTSDVKLTIKADGVKGTTYPTEVDAWQIQASKKSDYADVDPAKNENKNIANAQNASFSGEYFGMNTTYYMRAAASNPFGWSEWGNLEPPYTTLASAAGIAGVPAAPLSFKRKLYKYTGDKLVVNMIAPPKAMKASELTKAIEDQAGANSVIAISRSLPDLAKSEVYIPAVSKDNDFAIGAGEGVQVFLNETAEIELKSE